MADSFLRELWRRLRPSATASAPTSELPPSKAALAKRDQDEAIDALRVDPRARHLDLVDLERSASSPGFERLRIGGLPHWADAIAKKRRPGDPGPATAERIDPAFDEVASISGSQETRLALGPTIRQTLREALAHTWAVRLGEGFVEVIVPHVKANDRHVQDSVLSVARAFTGTLDPLERILRWAVEDDSSEMRRQCLFWLATNGRGDSRTTAVLTTCLGTETDDPVRLELAAALGGSAAAAAVIEEIAERQTASPLLRARAYTMLPSVCDDETRLDRLLLAGVHSGPAEVRTAALDAIASGRRAQLVPGLVALLAIGKVVSDALIKLGDTSAARLALDGAKRGEPVPLSLERIRLAAELGGKDSVEPLRGFLSSGNPRELATPARNAIELVKSRLTAIDGGLSIAAPDNRGRLSPAGRGGELSNAPAAGALSDAAPDPKRRR